MQVIDTMKLLAAIVTVPAVVHGKYSATDVSDFRLLIYESSNAELTN